jgi:hypothetical protein
VQAQSGDRDLWCDIWLNERYLGEGLHQLAVSHGWREHDIVITYGFAASGERQQQHGTSERLFSDDAVPAGSSVW